MTPEMRSIPGNIPHSAIPPPYFLPDKPPASRPLMAGSTVWKTIFVPPLIALFIYLSIAYVFLPLYRRRQRCAHYIPVSIPPLSSSYNRQGLVGRARERVLDALSPFSSGNRWRRGSSQGSADSMFGGEELEEGYGIGEIVTAETRNTNSGEERRLSRELEVGFRDDSDEDDIRDRDTELPRGNPR